MVGVWNMGHEIAWYNIKLPWFNLYFNFSINLDKLGLNVTASNITLHSSFVWDANVTHTEKINSLL